MSIPETLASLVVPIDSVEPYGDNPRDGDVGSIAVSLERNGQYRPIVVNKRDDAILAGNHTWKAAKSLGWDEIAATFVDVDEATARRIVLVDNRSNDVASYDDQALADLLESIAAEEGPEGLIGTGFDGDDLDELLADLDAQQLPDSLNDPDDVPEPPAEPTSKLGDVWLLGPHRVVCGDSTDVEALGSDEPAVVFTDPPYGIAYKAMRGGKDIAGDATADEAEPLIASAVGPAATAEAIFVCCDWRSHGTVLRALAAIGVEPKATIVWDKERGVQNLDRYHKQHEFIVYSGPYGGQPTQGGDVWRFPRDFDPDHPTPKPVELIEKALETASKRGALVYDPFGGSGSTLIAAHRTGRVARLVELDPSYVDVICRRYQEHTGDKPILESTGEPHDFTADG